MNTIFVPIITPNDTFLIQFAQKLINSSGSQIFFIDVHDEINKNVEIKESIHAIEQATPTYINRMNEQSIDSEFIKQQNLMLISAESWKYLNDTKSDWLTNLPSTLIIAKKE